MLREIDDHNALVRNLLAQGAFVPKVGSRTTLYIIVGTDILIDF
jgi:hypothetical protein